MARNLETMDNKLENITLSLFDYCRSNDWAGYDPYDALNSLLFQRIPFLDSRVPRLALTQLLKRSPVNFRPFLMIPKTHNPKAIALFLSAFLKLKKVGLLDDINLIPSMVRKLIDLRSQTPNPKPETRNDYSPATPHTPHPTPQPYWSWGYSFPWQGRSVLALRGAPNLVCTVFVANSLLDLYESGLYNSGERVNGDEAVSSDTAVPSTRGPDIFYMAASAADYLLNELYWSGGDLAGFSYPLPSIQTKVHNANFLGAALFCRIYKHTGDKKYLEPALKAARYSASRQHADGGWDYGEHEKQQWIDNFHTGYNLGALQTINECLKTDEFESNISKGFKFYRDHFFCENGIPKYFHDKVYPIDIHSVAQSIITLIELSDRDFDGTPLADKILEWAVTHMRDKQRGCFYYQVTPYFKNKISYMRWSQAWMLLALATLLEAKKC